MSLQSTVRSALGTIKGLIPETVITVISNGHTATGIGNTTSYGESLDANGERGLTTGRVILKANDLSTPEKGATILVNGFKAIVGNTSIDGVGALLTIDFQYTTEVQ